MKWKRLIGIGLLGFTICGIAEWTCGWSEALGPAKIVFASSRNGKSDIYVMNTNGEQQLNLTKNPLVSNIQPAWSPDGKKIVFSSIRDGIYVMQANGRNLHRLIDRLGGSPAWSPDGKKIVFSSTQDGNGDIYAMSTDGNNIHQLTNHPASDSDPAWSPNGREIVFVSGRDGGHHIYVMDTDGRNVRRVTWQRNWNNFPAWSPDGKKIAFSSVLEGGRLGERPGIFVMDADGKNIHMLTQGWDQYPVWSPDGRQIAFDGEIPNSPNRDIYVIDVDGKNERNLTRLLDSVESAPDWFDPEVPPYAVSTVGKRVITWAELKLKR